MKTCSRSGRRSFLGSALALALFIFLDDTAGAFLTELFGKYWDVLYLAAAAAGTFVYVMIAAELDLSRDDRK